MIHADSYYKYKADKIHGKSITYLLPELSKFDKFLWRLKGYQITKLPEDPDKDDDMNLDGCLIGHEDILMDVLGTEDGN